MSVRTVSRHVHELDYTSHCPIKEPIHTSVQKGCTVTYALKHLHWDDADWLDKLWSDEAMFPVTEGRSGNIYQKHDREPLHPHYLCRNMKHPSSLVMWNCFSGRRIGKLVVLPTNIKFNQYIYFELLNEHLEECFELTGANVF